jgi:DNA helicase-2/ATP-dependent DNA helicase PcrA
MPTHSRSFDDPEEMMEERRLFYVGITRAKDHLYLVHSENRNAYGYAEPVLPSRFLDDIPPELVYGRQPARSAGRSAGVAYRPERWSDSRSGSTRILQQQFQPGMRVEHPTWGEGMVLNSRLQDDDEIVDIFFEELGLKRVAASLAKLEIKK